MPRFQLPLLSLASMSWQRRTLLRQGVSWQLAAFWPTTICNGIAFRRHGSRSMVHFYDRAATTTGPARVVKAGEAVGRRNNGADIQSVRAGRYVCVGRW